MKITRLVLSAAVTFLVSTAANAQTQYWSGPWGVISDGGPVNWVGGTTIANPQNGNPADPNDGSNINNYYVPATSSMANLNAQGCTYPLVWAPWPPGPSSTYYGMDLGIDDTAKATQQLNGNTADFFNVTFNRNSDYTANLGVFTGGTVSVTTPHTFNLSGLAPTITDPGSNTSYYTTLTCNVASGGNLNITGNGAGAFPILTVKGAGTVTALTPGLSADLPGLNLQGGNMVLNAQLDTTVAAVTGSSGSLTINGGATFVTSGINSNVPITITSNATNGVPVTFDNSGSLVGGNFSAQGCTYIQFAQPNAVVTGTNFTAGGSVLNDYSSPFMECGGQNYWQAGMANLVCYGNGYTGGYNGEAYTDVLTLKGCTITPQGATAGSAGIFTACGNLCLAKNGSTKTTLNIAVVGTGGVAGTDFSKFQMSGAYTSSLSSGSAGTANPLADTQLDVNIASGLNNAALAGQTLTIVEAAGTNSSSYFADVLVVGGTADVHYADGEVTLSDIHSAPEPLTLSILALGGLAMLKRRK